jgi:hypothetical protein
MTTTTSLSSVASSVVGQYTTVGKLILSAYRDGAQRLVSGANERYATFLNSRALPMLDNNVKATLIDAQTKFAGMIEGGIKAGTQRAEQAIDFVAGGVNGGIQRVAETSGKIEKALNTEALSTVATVAILPVAQVSLTIADRVVEGTKRLSARVAGAQAAVEEAQAEVVAEVERVVKKTTRRAKAAA